jgi:hypothetical protein
MAMDKNFQIGAPTDFATQVINFLLIVFAFFCICLVVTNRCYVFRSQVSVNQNFEWNVTDGGGKPHESFELLRCVGQGAFGSVWQVCYNFEYRTVATTTTTKIIQLSIGSTQKRWIRSCSQDYSRATGRRRRNVGVAQRRDFDVEKVSSQECCVVLWRRSTRRRNVVVCLCSIDYSSYFVLIATFFVCVGF